MANEKKQAEQKQEQQPTTPAAQMELTDEELGQVTGGGIRVPDSPVLPRHPDTIVLDQ